jgi:hypothetical protein
MDRITIINKSLTAFICGLFGLLPVIGIPFGLAAIVFFVRTRLRKSTEWNPAEHYLNWAARLALIGAVLTLIVIALAMASAIQQGNHSHYGGNWFND